ncbi:AbrB family transcriptional regulator [Proteiniclasticum sp.]|uniref:AbrB family transcriptional regulator n=1 Tax=Proteiniclasticum sp. TaxID=2053595 RepID=UPI0028A2A26B|nr:AbrB family transcriptional regulator [Proteiniclasticum sp.]
MQYLLLTLAIAFSGGYILNRFRIPGGMMLGSVIAVALLNINTTFVEIPGSFRFVAQCIAGAYIGMTVRKEDLKKMKNFIKPTATLLFGLFVTNLIVGVIIYFISPMDLLTSFLSAIPGGISDTPLIASDMGADATKVTVLQFVRLVSGIAMVPLLLGKNGSKDESVESGVSLVEKKRPVFSRNLILAVAAAVVFGYIGKLSGVAAGTLLFAMAGIVILKIIGFEVTFPIWFKRMAQLFSGAYIGSHFGYQDVLELKYLLLPAAVIVVINILACYIMGNTLNRYHGIPRSQAILSSSPAGASDMALIASDIGVSGSDVALIQIFRLVGAVALFPQIFLLISKLFAS